MLKLVAIPLLAASITGCVVQLPSQEREPQPVAQQAPAQQTPMSSHQGLPNSDWVDVETLEGQRLQVKKGSFRFSKNSDEATVAVLVGRQVNLSSNDILLVQWSVNADQCLSQQGVIITYDMQGNPLASNDFVFGGGNIASNIAEAICGLAGDAARDMQRQIIHERTPAKPNGPAI